MQERRGSTWLRLGSGSGLGFGLGLGLGLGLKGEGREAGVNGEGDAADALFDLRNFSRGDARVLPLDAHLA